jgi:hypothetical protein
MFDLGVVDHVRLNLERASKNHAVHARAAERLARQTFKIRIAILVLTGAATASAIASLLYAHRPLQVAAVVASTVAFAAFAAYLATGFEERVLAHRRSAHHLLIVCERHRALLAEIHDGLLDRDQVRLRRDSLSAEVHALYEHPFRPDQVAYETVRQAVVEGDMDDRAPHLVPPPGTAQGASRN